jgi:hypothetical protein
MEEAVALIELGSSHDECLYAQIKFLQSYGIPVQLVVSDELFERRLDKRHGAEQVEVFPAAQNRLAEWSTNARVIKFLKGRGIRQAVLNTAHGKGARTLCTLAPRSLELLGIAHDARRLFNWSVTQALISRKIKKYFVLSDYIVKSLHRLGFKKPVSSFYPIYFPMLADAVDSGGRFWIAIPGKPEIKRRDYLGLIAALGRDKLAAKVQFLVLGNSTTGNGPEVHRCVVDAGLDESFVWFDRFVDYSTMLGYLGACQAVLPLVHPATDGFENYLHYQITGAFSLARAAGKPMLLHERFSECDEFRSEAMFYRENNLIERINLLLANPEESTRLSHDAATCERLSFAYQARAYVGYLRPDLIASR